MSSMPIAETRPQTTLHLEASAPFDLTPKQSPQTASRVDLETSIIRLQSAIAVCGDYAISSDRPLPESSPDSHRSVQDSMRVLLCHSRGEETLTAYVKNIEESTG